MYSKTRHRWVRELPEQVHVIFLGSKVALWQPLATHVLCTREFVILLYFACQNHDLT